MTWRSACRMAAARLGLVVAGAGACAAGVCYSGGAGYSAAWAATGLP